jgi:hypothetical protein
MYPVLGKKRKLEKKKRTVLESMLFHKSLIKNVYKEKRSLISLGRIQKKNVLNKAISRTNNNR